MLRNLLLYLPLLLLVHVTSAVALPLCNGNPTGLCEGTWSTSTGEK